MTKIAHLFQWSFRVMDHPKYYMNVMFIIIGSIGAIYWLWRQNNYNKEAEQRGGIK